MFKRNSVQKQNRIKNKSTFVCKQNPHPRKNEVKHIALMCDLKEDTVRNWFNNHRSSNKIKTEIKQEANNTGINYPSTTEPTNSYQVSPKSDAKVETTNLVELEVGGLPGVQVPECSQQLQKPIESDLQFGGRFSFGLHNCDTVDLGSLLSKQN